MQIIVHCPRCQSRYYLEASLKGKAIRCPGSACGHEFVIPENAPVVPENSPAPLPVRGPADGKQASGSVGSMVPLLNAESVPAPGPVPAQEPASWRQQPPPVRRDDAPQVKARLPGGDKPLIPPPLPAAPGRPVVPPPLPAAPAKPQSEHADWRQQAPPPRAPSGPPTPPAPAAEAVKGGKGGAPTESIRVPRSAPVTETMKMPAVDKPKPAGPSEPVELPPGAWEAPPVRKPADLFNFGSSPAPPLEKKPESALEKEIARARRARRRARLILVGLALLVIGLAGGAVWYLHQAGAQKEDKLYAEAQEKYRERDFAEAARLYHDLEQEYPKSGRVETYRFYTALSLARQPAYAHQATLEEAKQAYDNFLAFVKDNEDNELLKKARGDVRDTFYQLALHLTAWAEQKPDPSTLAVAQTALKEARKYREGNEVPPEDPAIQDQLAGLTQTLAAKVKRKILLGQLADLARRPSGESVQRALTLVHDAGQDQKGLGEDPEVLSLVKKVIQAHQGSVQFVAEAGDPKEQAPPEDGAPPAGGPAG